MYNDIELSEDCYLGEVLVSWKTSLNYPNTWRIT